MDQDSKEQQEGQGGGTYVTEHWAKARYSRSTSRPRFSSLRNSCTHLRGEGSLSSSQEGGPAQSGRPEQARALGAPPPLAGEDTKQPPS